MGIRATEVDLFADEVLLDPYPSYQLLRDAGDAVRLDSYDLWALARHEIVRFALARHDIFSSNSGVSSLKERDRSTGCSCS